MIQNSNNNKLTTRQAAYLRGYTDPMSPSFGNSYRSALSSGYSDTTARNITHLMPAWLSENIGKLSTILPDEIMTVLTVIYDDNEPTIIRLKALELSMKAHSMLTQKKSNTPEHVMITVDLVGTTNPTDNKSE